MEIQLQYFSKEEFHKWYDQMSPRFLVMMDVLRHFCGSRIFVSGHPDSLGRHLGKNSKSAHNVDFWDMVMGGDFFVEHVYYRRQALAVYQAALQVGFTGIGIYPQWTNNEGKQQVGFHFDCRPTKRMGFPATWGRVDGKYVSLHHALQRVDLAQEK